MSCRTCNYRNYKICFETYPELNKTFDKNTDCIRLCYPCLYKYLIKILPTNFNLRFNNAVIVFDIYSDSITGFYETKNSLFISKARIIRNRCCSKRTIATGHMSELISHNYCSNCSNNSCEYLRFYITIPDPTRVYLVAFCGSNCWEQFFKNYQRYLIKSTTCTTTLIKQTSESGVDITHVRF